MAREVIIRTVCDVCNIEDSRSVEGETYRLGFDSQWHEVELCERHAEALLATLAVLHKYGRIESGVPHNPNANSVACPKCHRLFKNRGSLGGHAREKHGASVAELEGKAATFQCDLCERRFARPQGLGMHRLKTHGVGVAR